MSLLHKPAKTALLILTMLAVMLVGILPAFAANAVLLDKTTITAELQSTSKADTYKLKVSGVAKTADISKIYVKVSDKSYKATFKSSSKSFSLSKDITLKGTKPTSISIEATAKKGETETLSVSLAANADLIDRSSLKVTKAKFMTRYAYTVSGKLAADNVTSVEVTIGDRVKEVIPENKAFYIEVIAKNATSVTIKAVDKTGKTDTYTYTIK